MLVPSSTFRHSVRRAVRRRLVRAQKSACLRGPLRAACAVGAHRVLQRLAACDGVEAVYIRHSHPSSREFILGLSDLDLTIVLSDDVADDPDRVTELHDRIDRASRRHVYLNAADVRTVTAQELNGYGARYVAPSELLYSPSDWRLAAGNDVRRVLVDTDASRLGPYEIAAHPEFNQMRQRLLDRIFQPPATGRVRSLYRTTLKNQLHLLHLDGVEIDRPQGFVSDEVPPGAFALDDELPRILASLYEQRFEESTSPSLESRLYHAVLRETAARTTALSAGEDWHVSLDDHVRLAEPDLDGEELGLSEEILRRVREVPDLDCSLAAIHAYPVPFDVAGQYVLDLVVPDDISPEQFTRFLGALRRTLGAGSAFEGAAVRITIHLESMIESPLLFLGSETPFLREHVARFAWVIRGKRPGWWRRPTDTEALRRRCMIHFPYHWFNATRRPVRLRSRLLLARLAAMRLYLESGLVATDRDELRSLCRDVFGDSHHAVVLEAEPEPGEHDPVLDRATFFHVELECFLIDQRLSGELAARSDWKSDLRSV